MKTTETIGGRDCTIYTMDGAQILLLQPVDDHDQSLLDSEVELICSHTDAPFNLVRARAAMPSISNVTVDQVLDERRMELVCEWGERYNDLIRTGLAASVLSGWNEGVKYYPLPLTQVQTVPTLSNDPKNE